MHETPKPEDFRNTDFSSLIQFRIKRILMICSNLAVSFIFPCACIGDIDLDTESIYTNIHGRLGVFGAMIHRSDKPGVSGYLNDWNPE